MPYCGPTFGLVDMQALTEKMNKPEEDQGGATPRQRGQPHKRRAPGEDAEPIDPAAPNDNGDGLFKSGTRHVHGIFQCPADMKFDIKVGHTQSDVLDKISESIRKLRHMQTALTGEETDWVDCEGMEAAPAPQKDTKAASSGARVKRQATGAKGASATYDSQL